MQELYNDFLLFWNNLTSGDIVDLGEYGFLSGATMQDSIGNGLYWLHVLDAMDDISGYK